MAQRKAAHRILLVLLMLVSYGWFLPPAVPEQFGTNNSVRFYLAKSLALDGSFTIEKYYLGGIDAAFYGGHYYSGKAPAASFLAVPVLRLAWGAVGPVPDWILLYIVGLAVISLPSVALVLLMLGFLLRLGLRDRLADILVVGYGLGTMAYPYSTQFVGHQLAAVFLFGCFLAVLRWRRGYDAPYLLIGAGLLGGLAVSADYQVAVPLAIVLVFSLFPPKGFRNLLLFAAGCIPGLFFILWYNYSCFGHVLSFPYAHEAMPAAREVQGQGLFGVQAPRLVPLVKLLFSPWRGLFFVSPFLLLVIPGLWCLARPISGEDEMRERVGVGPRSLFWTCLLVCAGYVLFNSSYGAWSGGSGYGPRFLVPILPFFIVPIAALAARDRACDSWLIVTLVAYSVAFHFVGTASGPLAHEYLRNPVREFLLPSLLRGNVRRNWLSLAGAPVWGAFGLYAAAMGCLICLFFATGKGGTARMEPVPAARAEKFLRWISIIAAVAMAVLFWFHGTEETAYKYGVLGHSYNMAGDEDAALPYFRRSFDMDPLNPLVIQDLTRILLRQGAYREALDVNVRALARLPGDPGLQARCALLMRAIELTEQLKSRPGDRELFSKRREIIRTLGCVPAEGEAKR